MGWLAHINRVLAAPDVTRRETVIAVVWCGLAYGAVMGSYGGLAGLTEARFLQMLYSAIKVPLLILGTAIIALPCYFVFHGLLGVLDDFGESVRAVFGTQGAVAVILASFAPVLAVWYQGSIGYREAVAVNGLIFALASIAGQVVLRRRYRALIQKDRRHRLLLFLWIGLYAFVGIQMGWVLRPFIGDPSFPPTFLRESAWGNAYVVVFELFRGIVGR